jgi:hypothetical protein
MVVKRAAGMKPKAHYRKSDAVKCIEAMANEAVRKKYPNLNPEFLAPRKYDDRTANGLCKCIIDFLRFKGHQAERISCTGRYLDQSKTITDTLGFTKRIGSGKWIKASMQAGTADISCIINGKAIKCELKIKTDKQRPEQVEYQKQVEAAGGAYWLCHSYDEFLTFYNSIVNKA